jgi:hypothetical protein
LGPPRMEAKEGLVPTLRSGHDCRAGKEGSPM